MKMVMFPMKIKDSTSTFMIYGSNVKPDMQDIITRFSSSSVKGFPYKSRLQNPIDKSLVAPFNKSFY